MRAISKAMNYHLISADAVGAKASLAVTLVLTLAAFSAFGYRMHVARQEVDAQRATDKNYAAAKASETTTLFGLIRVDHQGVIFEWNPGAAEVLGWTTADMKGQNVDRLQIVDGVESAMLRALFRAPGGDNVYGPMAVTLLHKSGVLVNVMVTITDLKGTRTIRIDRPQSESPLAI